MLNCCKLIGKQRFIQTLQRQQHRETTALVELAFDKNAAPVQLYKLFGDCQAYTAAQVQHRAGNIVLEERLEYLFHFIMRNADTSVDHLDLDVLSAFVIRADHIQQNARLSALGSKFI